MATQTLSLIEVEVSLKHLRSSKKLQIDDLIIKLNNVLFGNNPNNKNIDKIGLKNKIVHVNVPRGLNCLECQDEYQLLKKMVSGAIMHGINISIITLSSDPKIFK